MTVLSQESEDMVKAEQIIQEKRTLRISVAEIMEEYSLPETLIVKSARLSIGAPGTIVIEFENAEYQEITHEYRGGHDR